MNPKKKQVRTVLQSRALRSLSIICYLIPALLIVLYIMRELTGVHGDRRL